MMTQEEWNVTISDISIVFAVVIIGMAITGFTFKKIFQWVSRGFS